jgi:hypothetical protein
MISSIKSEKFSHTVKSYITQIHRDCLKRFSTFYARSIIKQIWRVYNNFKSMYMRCTRLWVVNIDFMLDFDSWRIWSTLTYAYCAWCICLHNLSLCESFKCKISRYMLKHKISCLSMDLQAYCHINNNMDMVTYLVEGGAGITSMATTHYIRPSSSHQLMYVNRFTNAIPVTNLNSIPTQFNLITQRKKHAVMNFMLLGTSLLLMASRGL